MACQVYEQMHEQLLSMQKHWAYFTYPENKALRGVSDHKAKKLAREQKDKMAELNRKMQLHRQLCQECSKAYQHRG